MNSIDCFERTKGVDCLFFIKSSKFQEQLKNFSSASLAEKFSIHVPEIYTKQK